MSSTTFPNAVQNFKRWENLTSTQLTAYVNYINALNMGDWANARKIFQDGGLSDKMLPTADDFNKMCDTILECKALYEAQDTSAKGIQDFMGQFSYKGDWDITKISQYKKFNIVRYNSTNSGTFLYIANQDITTQQTPWDNSTGVNPQWLRIVPVTVVNNNSVFKGNWLNNITYNAGDVVSVNDIFYKASATSVGQAPPNEIYWLELFDMNPYIARISSTQPTNIKQGAIWFKQL